MEQTNFQNACSVQILGNNVDSPYQLLIRGNGGDSVLLDLTQQQVRLLNSRFSRVYLKRCRAERIYEAIENASNCTQLEEIVRGYSLCDACDFKNINLYGLKRVLKVVVDILYRYPKLRSKMCYLGSPKGYSSAMHRMACGDVNILRDFALQYICEEGVARNLGALMLNMIRSWINHDDSYIAMAVHAFGMFDAVLFDENDYDGYSYISLVSNLRRSAVSGFHPQGCNTPESVVYHELGHLIDYLCGITEKNVLRDYLARLSEYEVRTKLSQYATTSPMELVAEAFAEYMCNETPRSIAQYVGMVIDRVYANLP